MSELEQNQSLEDHARDLALGLGRTVLGREPNADEAESLTIIFHATVQALQHGFIRRMAAHVAAERTDESVEEFFEDVIKPD